MSGAPVRAPIIGSAPLPLLGVAVGLLAAAGFLHGTGSTAGSPHLPLWLLFLGMGIIVLGGGVAVVVLRGDAESGEVGYAEAEAPSDDTPPMESEAVPEVASLPPVPEPPDPPRPIATWSGERPGRTAGAASASAAPLPSSRPTPTSSAPVPTAPVAAAADGEGGLTCATCGKPLPARAAWRRCRTCGKSLCVVCLTESVRSYGSGYCAACAPTVA